MDTIQFPVYRRYSDLKTFFKISSNEEFTELKQIGKYYSISQFKATIHPERMFIGDLVNCEVSSIELSTEEEFNSTRESWEKNLISFSI